MKYKNTIIPIILKAGHILISKQQNLIKSGNPDILAEKYIIIKLKKLYPRYQIISEESYHSEEIKNDYVWVVDPIDGTFSYKNGFSDYAIGIGLIVKGLPSFGVVYAPALNALWYGNSSISMLEKNGEIQRLHMPNIKNISQAKIVVSPSYKNDKRKTIDHELFLWDILPAYCIVKGSSGIVSDFNGSDLFESFVEKSVKKTYKNFICAQNKLGKELLSILQQTP